MSINAERIRIIERLHDLVGTCIHCGRLQCSHGSNTVLPKMLPLDMVLRAINVDNYFSDESDYGDDLSG